MEIQFSWDEYISAWTSFWEAALKDESLEWQQDLAFESLEDRIAQARAYFHQKRIFVG